MSGQKHFTVLRECMGANSLRLCGQGLEVLRVLLQRLEGQKRGLPPITWGRDLERAPPRLTQELQEGGTPTLQHKTASTFDLSIGGPIHGKRTDNSYAPGANALLTWVGV